MLSLEVRDTVSFRSTSTSPRAYKLEQCKILLFQFDMGHRATEKFKTREEKIVARNYFVLLVFES